MDTGFQNLVAEARSRIRETTAEEVRRRQEAGDRIHLVDVREDGEWQKGRAAGSRHLSRGILERDIEIAIPGHEAEIVLYCGGGSRSALAAESLQRMGYTRVWSMEGGWKRWRELGYPTESGERAPVVPPPKPGGLWP